MRRGLTLAAIVATTLTWATPAAAASISFDNITSVGAGAFTVDVNITGAVNLYSFGFDVTYDPLAVTDFSATEGSFLALNADPQGSVATFFFVIPLDPDPISGGPASVANTIVGYPTGASGDGLLATLRFLLSGPSATVTFDNLSLLDPNGADLGGSIENPSVALGQTTPVPEPATLLLFGLGAAGSARRLKRSWSKKTIGVPRTWITAE